MHMADALLSPTVGGALWAVSAGAIAFCSAGLRRAADDRQAPLMGVLGAFLFAAQTINFYIPGTGSSGHLAGGVLLAVLLGPQAAFLTVASVLVVQALFFADGGLLALGCNIFNLAVIPAFVVFPLYRRFIGTLPGKLREGAVTVAASVVAMQLGAFFVVLETVASGVSSLPFFKFLLVMQPIHLAIGVVEGAVTVAVVTFVRRARPELLQSAAGAPVAARRSRARVLLALLALAITGAGGLSWFASERPDGLEWSIAKLTGHAELKAVQRGVHGAVATLQDKSAFFRDYTFDAVEPVAAAGPTRAAGAGDGRSTALAGVVGTLLTLLLVCLGGMLLKKGSRETAARQL